LFGIIPVVDNSNDIIQAVFSFHTLMGSSFKPVYFWSFSLIMLCRVWVLGIATAIKYASLMELSGMTVSGLLLWTVRSVIMDLSRYNF
jgi:hypothetical protein